MAYKVVWTKKARKQRVETLTYGALTFGKRLALKFKEALHQYDRLLASNSHLGPIEPLLIQEPQIFRSVVVHKHYKLIYYVNTNSNTIYIVALWDNRREPKQQAKQTR